MARLARSARSARRRGYTARAHWRGGFVDAVELPAASFLSHAADLIAAHPITCVRLTDKHPGSADSAGGVGWTPAAAAPVGRHAFHRLGARRGVGLPSDLPPELFATGLPAALFDSAAGADEGLSRACVAHGRHLAGLPTLA